MKTETVEFKITEGDIRRGIPGKCRYCAGALSIIRRLGPTAHGIQVGLGQVVVHWGCRTMSDLAFVLLMIFVWVLCLWANEVDRD